MADIAISSNDNGCKSLQSWFFKYKNCQGPDGFSGLQSGETLYIIAHDSELKDGSGLIGIMLGWDYPMTDFNIVLIVCSANSYMFSEDLVTPAERIANHFKRNVLASDTIVTGVWNDDGTAFFKGNFKVVHPGDDLISKFGNLKLNN